MKVFYNDTDRFCCDWMSNLMDRGVIAPGTIDDRPIQEIPPTDLRGYTQCHWFAGIATWNYALRLAGWSDDRQVWTGSCPCQSFSQAGARKGFADERHLWPYWHHLIRVCRPPVIFGEQVASKDALQWLDLVQDDLEGEGYAVGAADLCAASVGAPHIRQRLYFVADARSIGCDRRAKTSGAREGACSGSPDGSETSLLADALPTGWAEGRPIAGSGSTTRSGGANELGGFWSDADWLYCRDGKYRPARSGSFPLAHGAPARVGRLRAYGNCIVPQVAAEFIRAYTDVRGPVHD